MTFVRSEGFPAPEVFDVSDDGREMVRERIDGPTMVEHGVTRPWRIPTMGRELAGLHVARHRLAAPSWLPQAPFGLGYRLVHLDLHPLNVLIGRDGPIVIDWTNAARGEPLADVALTWALIAAGEVTARHLPSLLHAVGRRQFLRAFLQPFRGDAVRAMLVAAVEWKCTDPNMSATGLSRLRSLV